MKKLFLGFLTLITLNLNAQVMDTPIDVVTQLFIATDAKDWSQIENIFSSEVTLDYSSMNGNPAIQMTPGAIIELWQGILPGFSSTHHQLGNFQTVINDNKAHIFCYGTAIHYLEDENGSVWTVVGSYDFDLFQANDNSWKISSMTFNFKYMDGNASLPEKAMNNLK